MPAYSVRQIEPVEGRQAVIDIWRRNLSETDRLDEKFDWHFLRNPYGPGKCWILYADQDQPVGTASLGLRRLNLGTSAVTVGLACDLAVDEAHRFLQAAIQLQRAVANATSEDLPIVYGLPNSQATAPVLRVGYKVISSVERYAKPLRPSQALNRHRVLAQVKPIVGGVMDATYRLLTSAVERSLHGYIPERLDEFDDRFDALWENTRQSYEVIGVRNRQFLHWRYRMCPLKSYTIVGLLAPDRSRLVGYVVYYLEDEVAYCADLFTDPTREVMEALISAWKRDARSRWAKSISIHCSPHPVLLSALTQHGFRQRTAAPNPRVKRTAEDQPNRTLLAYMRPGFDLGGRESWFFTPGDEPYN